MIISEACRGLIEASRENHQREILRQPSNQANVVFSKVRLGICVSLGWLVFLIVVIIFLAITVASQGNMGSELSTLF
jgi:hypothetical protein